MIGMGRSKTIPKNNAVYHPKCPICNHPKRDEIEFAIINEIAQREIADTFSSGKNSFNQRWVSRHFSEHMKEAMAEKIADLNKKGSLIFRDVHTEYDSMIDEIDGLIDSTMQVSVLDIDDVNKKGLALTRLYMIKNKLLAETHKIQKEKNPAAAVGGKKDLAAVLRDQREAANG